ncbi:type 4a pilus biogenesis protein PilO [Paenibacillus nasutitermitis]|uniref:Type IV pilus assembly protein PilO n=1 Tax=Paenibacillus nasutitermitis TaxID=1652958 RepID=A0A916YJS3_9BACL|nr:type 4a pilus biogenesis protein PilO [Paenibacillus nasutitermitis]GGD48034.1 hypothetical protein GCM10010911_01970 [Paenibacillus nasutitermitis]
MEQLNKNRKLALLLVALMFLVLLAVYIYMLLPKTRQVSDQQDVIARLESQTRLLQKKLDEKKSSESKYSQETVQAALPLWDNTEQMLMDLEQIGKTTRVQNVSLAFAADSGVDNETSAQQDVMSAVRELKISSSIKGSYADILTYISRLEALPRLIKVDNLEITKPDAFQNNAAMITVNLSFTAYYDPSYKDLVDEQQLPFMK